MLFKISTITANAFQGQHHLPKEFAKLAYMYVEIFWRFKKKHIYYFYNVSIGFDSYSNKQ